MNSRRIIIVKLEQLGLYLIDSNGKDLAGKIVLRYANDLSAVIHSKQDMQNLLVVLRDAGAWHKVTGRKWPDRVLDQAIAAAVETAR